MYHRNFVAWLVDLLNALFFTSIGAAILAIPVALFMRKKLRGLTQEPMPMRHLWWAAFLPLLVFAAVGVVANLTGWPLLEIAIIPLSFYFLYSMLKGDLTQLVDGDNGKRMAVIISARVTWFVFLFFIALDVAVIAIESRRS